MIISGYPVSCILIAGYSHYHSQQLGNVNTLGAGVFYDFNSPVDKLLAQRKEMEKSRAESIEAEKRFRQSMRTADEDKGKGLPGILGVDNA